MLQSVIRVFFAADVPTSVKKNIGQFIEVLKKRETPHTVQWVEPKHLHITLQFLVEFDSRLLPVLLANVREKIIGKIPVVEVSLGSIELFPNKYQPRAIVLLVHADEQLKKLAKLIGEGIEDSKYSIDSRPFRAHITIARLPFTRINHTPNLSFLLEPALTLKTKWQVNNVVLIRSEPFALKTKYTLIDKIIFA